MTDHPVPVFVYGSLLSGLHNHIMAERALTAPPQQARTLNGFKLYSNRGASFPYLAKAEEGVVQGELLWIERGHALDRIVGMELGAGYDAEPINIEVFDIKYGVWKQIDTKVIAFIHREENASARGEHVADGDWRKYHAKHGFDWSPYVRTPRSTPSRFAN